MAEVEKLLQPITKTPSNKGLISRPQSGVLARFYLQGDSNSKGNALFNDDDDEDDDYEQPPSTAANESSINPAVQQKKKRLSSKRRKSVKGGRSHHKKKDAIMAT